MKITVIGAGYVGLVSAACLSEMGNDVVCLDLDRARIRMLEQGRVPIHEPGLEPLVRRNAAAGRLRFTMDAPAAVAHGTLQFIAVGTPPDEDGSADLRHVLAAARSIGEHMSDYKVIIDKSTVPVGTAERVRQEVRQALQRRGCDIGYSVVSNPEFLKEGAAVDDFMRPDRILIGADDEQAIGWMRAVYAPFVRNHDRLQLMDSRSAEFTKYAANAMLATRISFMNELALLAEHVGADIELVRRGIGSDRRIGTDFLYPGAGYGGSCFPKDVRALIRTGAQHGVTLGVLTAVEAANERQKRVLADKVVQRFGADLSGRTFAVWGLSFKPNTDDMREAPSRAVVEALTERGAALRLYDPVAMPSARQVLAQIDDLCFVDSPYEALKGSDALLIVTEWREFKSPDFNVIRQLLETPVVFDGRNLFDPALVRSFGLEYHSIGRRSEPARSFSGAAT